MSKFLKIILAGALLFAGVSCGEFNDELLTTNPNSPVKVSPETLLASSLRSISSVVSLTAPELYIQHMTETQYTEESRYQTIRFDFNGWYTGPLANLQHIIDLNTNEATRVEALASGSNANQIAVARILKAYFYQNITDRWGPIPYSQALQGRANFKPAYDDQQAIYTDLIKELKEANAQMDGGAPVKGDFLFGGDMDMWKTFANSLRAVLALRMSNAAPDVARTEFAAAIAAGVISSDDQSVLYPYLAEANNQNPWFAAFITRTDWAITTTMVDRMRFPFGSTPDPGKEPGKAQMEFQDPRLDVYADPAPDFDFVRGMPPGIEAAGDIPNSEISFPNFPNVRGQSAPLPILTYSQILFAQAEAAHRGWISGDAKALYEMAIQASLRQWGVYNENSYKELIARPEVAWDAARALELIGYQKWIANYLQGVEAWSEWRRLGYPELTPSPDPLNESGEIPRRQGYPVSESDLNGPNYEKGVQMLGGPDNLDTPLWWDK